MILGNHVDDNIRVIFDKYYAKYCSYENTIKRTRDIISDVNYFTEHIARCKKSKFLDYTVVPSNTNSIHNEFVKRIGSEIVRERHNENQCMIYVALYEIMSGIFRMYYDTETDTVLEYTEFKPVLEYYIYQYSDEYLNCFIGCSHGLTDFYSKLNK